MLKSIVERFHKVGSVHIWERKIEKRTSAISDNAVIDVSSSKFARGIEDTSACQQCLKPARVCGNDLNGQASVDFYS